LKNAEKQCIQHLRFFLENIDCTSLTLSMNHGHTCRVS